MSTPVELNSFQVRTQALSAAVFWGIGSGFQQVRGPAGSGIRGSGFTSGQMTAKIAAHGAAGGTLSVLQGGKFGHGFVSAGITEAVSPAIAGAGGSGPKGLATRAVLSAAVGGTVSKITGGKFANGAATGAFQSLFNEGAHEISAANAQKRLEATTAAFNQKIEGLDSFRFGSADAAAAFFAGLAQPITTRYQIELGANINKDANGFYLEDFIVSNTFDPATGEGYSVELKPPLYTPAPGYVHTHPQTTGFSLGDLDVAVMRYELAFASRPDGTMIQFSQRNWMLAGSPAFSNTATLSDPRYVTQSYHWRK